MARGWWVVLVSVALASRLHAADRDGSFLYAAYCASCHGAEARGDGPDAEMFSTPPANLRAGTLERFRDDELVARIRHGRMLAVARDPEAMKARAGATETLVAH